MQPEASADRPLWAFIPLYDYAPPAEPVALAVKKGFSAIIQRFRTTPSGESGDADRPLSVLDPEERMRFADEPDWGAGAEALASTIDKWKSGPRGRDPLFFLAGAPFSGYLEILDTWRRDNRVRLIDPPERSGILESGRGWMKQFGKGKGLWVLPRLEHCFLRHTRGLSLIRNFLEEASAGTFGEGVIGCGGWSWSFLQHVWRGSHLPVYTQQPVDYRLLAEQLWRIASAARSRGNRGSLRFIQTDGEPVLHYSEPDASVYAGNFIMKLASYSGGNIGVALEIWRGALKKEEKTSSRESGTVWVSDWDSLSLPALPPSMGDNEAFVLHALMLHGSLTYGLMDILLPLSRSGISETCFLLEKAGLIKRDEAFWMINPPAYPVVRAYLRENDYLLDPF